MTQKQFAQRLNQELDDIDLPQRMEDRVTLFAKLINVPRFKAETLLNGSCLPDAALLELIAKELEVSADWLLGHQQEKH